MTGQPGAPRDRAANALLWCLPVVFLIALFWDGLWAWFLADDFAWLSLSRQLHNGVSLFSLLFAPAAQGTIRPWSERGFFLLFESLFGLDALPFRALAFLTMSANLLLLAWVTRRLTGSRVAGFAAAVVWAANTALMTVMTWSAAYNQALCPLFLLGALALFIRFAETGERRFWWLQTVVFLLGFGALEINVVFPALALAWALFVADPGGRRRLVWSVVPLAALSVVYFVIHKIVAPLPATGAYVIHLDGRIFRTLALYGKWSLLPVDWTAFGHSARAGKGILWVGIAALTFLFATELRRRRNGVLFGAAWYLATLAPVLPLPDHHSDYYLTIPVAGLAMTAAWGLAAALRSGANRRVWAGLAGLAMVVHLAGMIPISRAATRWAYDKSQAVRGVVLGVQAAHQTHPGKPILLDGMSEQLYHDSAGQGAFYSLGFDAVYLTPGSEKNIQGGTGLADVNSLLIDPAVTFHALQNDEVVVYSMAGDHLRNITEAYGRSAYGRLIDPAVGASRIPGRVDAGNPLYAFLLGPSWLAMESGVRWMPGSATVRIRGSREGSRLSIEGFCPEEQLREGGRHLIVSADGIRLGETQINVPETTFRRLFPLDPWRAQSERAGYPVRDEMQIEIRVEPVTRKGGQDYGVLFGKFEIVK